MNYGSGAFYNKKLYLNEGYWQDILKNFQNEIERNHTDPVIIHHQHSYNGKFPIWVVVEYLSFNNISKLFSNLQDPDKKYIAINFYNMNEMVLKQWFHALSVFRNICAHYGYLYKRTYPLSPRILSKYGQELKDNKSLFSILLAIKELTDISVFQNLIQEIIKKSKLTNSFLLADYGFPNNWQELLI